MQNYSCGMDSENTALLKNVLLLQKINVVLLCENALDLPLSQRAVDPQHVRDAIVDGQLWVLEHKSVLPSECEGVSSETAKETQSILHMWGLVEYAYSRLSDVDKDYVRSATQLSSVRFPGFDGNAEAGHLAAARLLIEKLGEYRGFRDRELNSHAPLLEASLRMLPEFHSFVMSAAANPLSKDNLVTVLRAMRHPSARE